MTHDRDSISDERTESWWDVRPRRVREPRDSVQDEIDEMLERQKRELAAVCGPVERQVDEVMNRE